MLRANDEEQHAGPLGGMACVGAAAAALGVVTRAQLSAAIDDELGELTDRARERSSTEALATFDAMAEHHGVVIPSARDQSHRPSVRWVELAQEPVDVAAPAIFGAGTSVQVRTGLWRTMRPVIDREHCHRCHWMCALPCPDSAITVDEEGYPAVDLEHCKGCLICVAQCPFHVISAISEHAAQQAQARGET